MTDATVDLEGRPRRRRVLLVVGMAALAWASAVLWQHELRAADAAVRADAAATRAYDATEHQSRAAQARLAQANQVIDTVRSTLDRGPELGALGDALVAMHGDVESATGLFADVADALARRDFTTYDELRTRLRLASGAVTLHAAQESSLHAQLRLVSCEGCSS